MRISDIQKILDETAALERSLSAYQISNRMKGAERKGDTDFASVIKATHQKDKSRLRSVTTPYGKFESIAEFQRQTGLKFRDRKHRMPHLYYRDDQGPGEVNYEWVGYTPYGIIPLGWSRDAKKYDIMTIKKCWQRARDAGDKSALNNTNHQDWFYWNVKSNPEKYQRVKEPRREWLLEGE